VVVGYAGAAGPDAAMGLAGLAGTESLAGRSAAAGPTRPARPAGANPMNPRRHRVRNIVWRICAAVLLCAAPGALAQTVYRQVDAAGHTTFTDRPGPEPSLLAAAGPAADTAVDVASALASDSAMFSRRAARIDAVEAARRLRQAQLEREQGAQPLPGEQAQGAGAGLVNDRYRQRQEKLRRAVEHAQRRLNETRRSHRASR